MLYSADLTSAQYTPATYGTGTISRTANYGIAPDGTMSADRIQMTKGDFAAEIYQRPLTTPGTYTLSFWAQSLNGTPTLYTAFNNGYENPVTFTTEWVRYEYTYTNTNFFTGFNLITYTGLSGTSDSADLLIWGVQLEAGSYATSYIPTTSASVTRNADVISKTGSSSLIGQTEGTLFFDIVFPQNSTASYVGISDGTYANRIIFGCEGGSFFTFGYGSGSSLPLSINTRYKICFAYNSTNMKVYANGALLLTETGTAPSSFDRLVFKSGAGIQNLIASVNAVALWKTKLSDTQLAQLTTI
jgi:hypothetical protein